VRVALFLAMLLAALASVAGANTRTIVVSAPWSRPAIGTGVVYLTIANRSATPDRLVGATSPIADAAEIHQSTEAMKSMSSMHGMAMGGVASMHHVAFVSVPEHATVTFAPGGYHIMLIGLHHDLHANETFPLRLRFSRAGWVAVRVHVDRI
jgi:copper(I)-binding protein